jgi:hypothetical protein
MFPMADCDVRRSFGSCRSALQRPFCGPEIWLHTTTQLQPEATASASCLDYVLRSDSVSYSIRGAPCRRPNHPWPRQSLLGPSSGDRFQTAEPFYVPPLMHYRKKSFSFTRSICYCLCESCLSQSFAYYLRTALLAFIVDLVVKGKRHDAPKKYP